MGAKQAYRSLRLYALEDIEENFAGAVCIHDPSVDPEYTWDHLIGPFDLIAVSRSGHSESDAPPPPDDSDVIATASQPPTKSSRSPEKDIREEHHAWLEGVSQWLPSIVTEDPYFVTSPGKRFYDSRKNWAIYNVLIIQQPGSYNYRIGVGRCFAEAFWRNKATRKEIALS